MDEAHLRVQQYRVETYIERARRAAAAAWIFIEWILLFAVNLITGVNRPLKCLLANLNLI